MAVPSESDLSATQRSSLAQYREITAQEVEPAIRLLQSTDWDVPSAVSHFFEHGPEPRARPAVEPILPPSITRSTASGNASAAAGNVRARRTHREKSNLIPAPRVVSPSSGQMFATIRPPFFLSLLLSPFGLLFSLVARVFRTVGFFVPALPRLLARLTAGTVFSQMVNRGQGGVANLSKSSSLGTRKALVGQDAFERVLREFCDHGLIEKNCPIQFYRGSYAAAFDTARRESRFLAVILLSFEHDDTASYIRKTLLSDEMLAVIGSEGLHADMLIWLGDVRDAEAFQVMTSLSVHSLPFFGVVAPVQAKQSTGGSSGMAQLVRFQGAAPASQLCPALVSSLQRFHDTLYEQRRRNHELETARQLRERQDAEYEESLRRDRELQEKAAAEEARREEEARAAAREAQMNDIREQKRADWRRWKRAELASSKIHVPTDGNAVRLRLQLPHGESQLHHFPPDLSVVDLYTVIECLILRPDDGPTASGGKRSGGVPLLAPEGYVHEFDFRIVQPITRGAIEPTKPDGIAKHVGRGAKLVVEMLEDEGDGGSGPGGFVNREDGGVEAGCRSGGLLDVLEEKRTNART